MKKISILFTFFILLTAFTCENEPIDQDLLDNQETDLSCQEASLNTADAALAFINNMASGGNYTALCSAYKEALENQILACGDPDGSIQQSITALGDCIDPNDFTDCQAAENAVNLAQINFENASDENYEDLCIIYKTALENQIAECGDDGSLQAAINALGNCVSESVGSFALMTANLDGVQYNDMKPNGYNIFNSAISIVTFSYANDYDYISIDGNSTYQEIIPDVTSTKEIKLYIPENTWEEGTYVLQTDPVYDNDGEEVVPHFDINFFYVNNALGYPDYDNPGTITITNFDLEDRVISGTFEFEYRIVDNSNNEETGPFQCIDGTFNYSLDDEYFN